MTKHWPKAVWTYSYSRYCAPLKERLGTEAARHRCASGLWGLSDFSGKTLALRTGRGENNVEIFVAMLAHAQ